MAPHLSISDGHSTCHAPSFKPSSTANVMPPLSEIKVVQPSNKSKQTTSTALIGTKLDKGDGAVWAEITSNDVSMIPLTLSKGVIASACKAANCAAFSKDHGKVIAAVCHTNSNSKVTALMLFTFKTRLCSLHSQAKKNRHPSVGWRATTVLVIDEVLLKLAGPSRGRLQ